MGLGLLVSNGIYEVRLNLTCKEEIDLSDIQEPAERVTKSVVTDSIIQN